MSEQKMREALEQILHKAANGAWTRHEVEACAREALAQQPAAVVELTDADILNVMRDGYGCRENDWQDHINFARAIIAKQGGAD